MFMWVEDNGKESLMKLPDKKPSDDLDDFFQTIYKAAKIQVPDRG